MQFISFNCLHFFGLTFGIFTVDFGDTKRLRLHFLMYFKYVTAVLMAIAARLENL